MRFRIIINGVSNKLAVFYPSSLIFCPLKKKMVLFVGDQDNSRRSEPPIPTSPTSPTSPVSASGSTKSIPGAVGGADLLVWVKAVSGGKVGECAQIKRDCLTKRQQIVDDSS